MGNVSEDDQIHHSYWDFLRELMKPRETADVRRSGELRACASHLQLFWLTASTPVYCWVAQIDAEIW